MSNEMLVDKQDAWEFIVARYRELTPDQSKHLHALQDKHGLDIVLHLFQAYSASRLGRSLAPDEVAAAQSHVAGWRSEVILPLRRLRRALKEPPSFPAGLLDRAQALRARIAQMEIDAEEAEVYALCDWLSAHASARPAPPGTWSAAQSD